jgi:hypothetical protein
MATNTVVKDLGTYSLKSSPDYPVGAREEEKLTRSLDLACRVLRSVIARLQAIATLERPAPSTIGEVPYKTLRYHLKLDGLGLERGEDVRFSGAGWTAWRADLERAREVAGRILQGLSTHPTIADSHASTVKKETMSNARELLALAATKYNTAANNLTPQMRMGVFMLAEQQAVESSKTTAGFVQPRKAVVAAMSPDEFARRKKNEPTAGLQPQDKGSIHINFTTLLGEAKYKHLHVARTIIHEASHKFCDTHDFAYSYEPAYATLTKPQAMTNADSHAYAAVCLYKGQFFGDSQTMLAASAGMDLDT